MTNRETATGSLGTKVKKNYKILLVCDDEARSAYLKSLAHISRNVEFVCDGDEAVAAIEQRTFDLVLLDVRTPIVAMLRAVKLKSPDSEVVVVANHPNLADAKETVRLGAYDYVAKPVGPYEVINLSGAALTHKRWALRTEHRP